MRAAVISLTNKTSDDRERQTVENVVLLIDKQSALDSRWSERQGMEINSLPDREGTILMWILSRKKVVPLPISVV